MKTTASVIQWCVKVAAMFVAFRYAWIVGGRPLLVAFVALYISLAFVFRVEDRAA